MSDIDNEKNEGKKERDIFERTSHYDPLDKKEENKPEGNADNQGKPDGGIKINSPVMAWLENFFYHYKWHTIAVLFGIFIIVFCSLQMCAKTTYDLHIIYAGDKDLRTVYEGEDEDTFTPLYSAIQRFVSDFDGNGERLISMRDIYLPSDETIREAEAAGKGVNYTLLNENDELFRQSIYNGDYYICLISKPLFDEWTKTEKSNPFVKITDYLPSEAVIAEGSNEEGYLLAGEYGVYLSSTPTADNPGFNMLPEDTIICMRKYIGTSSIGNDKKAESYYAHTEETFRKLLSNKAYE